MALASASSVATVGQDLLPDALSALQDPSERRTIEIALDAKNLLQSDSRLCGVGRLQADDGAGTLLVVSIEENGKYCNTVAVIRSVPEPQLIETLQATGGADRLDLLLRDLDNDGVPELVFERYLGSFSSECLAVVPVAYKCNANGCSEQSRRFPDFLVRELENIRRRIAWLSGSSHADTSCLGIERDKILRLLGNDRLAGLPLARQWAQSADPIARQKAALVAGDIDDPTATQLLEMLAGDKDQVVARAAARAIQARSQR